MSERKQKKSKNESACERRATQLVGLAATSRSSFPALVIAYLEIKVKVLSLLRGFLLLVLVPFQLMEHLEPTRAIERHQGGIIMALCQWVFVRSRGQRQAAEKKIRLAAARARTRA